MPTKSCLLGSAKIRIRGHPTLAIHNLVPATVSVLAVLIRTWSAFSLFAIVVFLDRDSMSMPASLLNRPFLVIVSNNRTHVTHPLSLAPAPARRTSHVTEIARLEIQEVRVRRGARNAQGPRPWPRIPHWPAPHTHAAQRPAGRFRSGHPLPLSTRRKHTRARGDYAHIRGRFRIRPSLMRIPKVERLLLSRCHRRCMSRWAARRVRSVWRVRIQVGPAASSSLTSTMT